MDLLVLLIRGIGLGAVLSLIAMSANVIVNSTGILNFAQGHLLVAGGVMSYLTFPAGANLGRWWLALPLVVLGMAALASFQGLLTLLPLRSSTEQHSWIITTLAASIILGGVITVGFGPVSLPLSNPWGGFTVGDGIQIPWIYLLVPLLAVLVWAGLWFFQRRTLVGLALNAISQDLDAAASLGAPIRRLQLLSFTIAGVILGLTAHLGGPILAVNQASGLEYATYAFIALVLGGIGNNLGALIAGPVFGVLQMIITVQIGGIFQLPLALLVIVVVLMMRPQGVFGRLKTRTV